MTLEELYKMQLKGFKLVYPNIQIPIDHKESFIRRNRKYTGTGYTRIEWIPGVLDNDANLLQALDDLIDYLLVNYKASDDDLRKDGTFNTMKFSEKDIRRLQVIVSSDMLGTIANPDYLNIKYDEKFMQFFDDCLNELGNSLQWLPDVNCYIRKRKGSSNGSFLGDNSEKTTSLLYETLKLNMTNNGWNYILNVLSFEGKFQTKPTTRRMVKAPKVYEDYVSPGVKITIDRSLTRKEDLSLNEQLKWELSGPRHRYVCNTSEAERMTSIFQMPVYTSVISEYDYSLIPDLPRINEALQECKNIMGNDFSVLTTDGSAYDKHITEDLMYKVETFISKFIANDKGINLHAMFRDLKDVYFPDEQGGVISSTEFAKEIHPELRGYKTILGLDSGHWLVSFIGKIVMTINVLYIISLVRNVSAVDYCKFLKGKLVINEGGRVYPIKIFNSSDDNMLILPLSLREDILSIINQANNQNDKVHLPFLPIEEDPDYLSYRVDYVNEKPQLVDNLMRRIASMLKPEYGVNYEDDRKGYYKNYIIGFRDKLATIEKYDHGKEIMNKLYGLLQEHKVIRCSNIMDELNLKSHDYPIYEVGELPAHLLASLNEEETLVLQNSEYYYYKVDPKKIRNEVLDYLFYHVKPEYFKSVYDALKIPYKNG